MRTRFAPIVLAVSLGAVGAGALLAAEKGHAPASGLSSLPADVTRASAAPAGSLRNSVPPAGPGVVDALAHASQPQATGNAEKAAETWPEDEVILARALCAETLKGVDAVVEPLEPIREGECGTPAPYRLISVGRNPVVTLSPAPTVTCGLVASMATWVEHDVQQLARTHLGAPVVKINTMSSYSCRTAYGRKKTRLSEHGRANAVDIRSFVTAGAVEADVLSAWGMTERDVRAEVAAAKATAESQAAALGPTADKPGGIASPPDAAAPQIVARDGTGRSQKIIAADPYTYTASPTNREVLGQRLQTIVEGLPQIRFGAAGVRPSEAPSLALTAPNRLGGPGTQQGAGAGQPGKAGAVKAPDTKAVAGSSQTAALPLQPELQDRKALFLRAAHVSACRRFGTVLGPEANEAHRNHLHVDKAERPLSSFCE